MFQMKDLRIALKPLMQRLESDLVQLLSNALSTGANTLRSEVLPALPNDFDPGRPAIFPGHPGLSMTHAGHEPQNLYTYNTETVTGHQPGYGAMYGPDVGQPSHLHQSMPSYAMMQQQLGAAPLGFGNMSGHIQGLENHRGVELTETHPPQTSGMSPCPGTGTVHHHDLYLRHWKEDQTSFHPELDLFEEFRPAANGAKAVFRYRLDRTTPPSGGTVHFGQPTPWLSEDGRYILNVEGAQLRYSKYLPHTISTKIEGWRMELIMRHDSNVTENDFLDRMPIDTGLHRRRQASSLKTRRSQAREEFVFQEIDNTPADQQNSAV